MAMASESSSIPGIMVFRPTIEEFSDFSAYIKKMEDCGAHKFGIAKVIPPEEWYASKNYDMIKIGKMVIDSPIAQLVTGQQGIYQQFNIQQKPMTVQELKELAESTKYRPPAGDAEKMERAYWKNVTFNPPIYGADVAGSIYDSDVKFWNINHLNTILDLIESEKNVKILGVNTAYLYFGMWKTSFAWHTEDMDLYSINYLHFGASKSWYAIPPEHGKRLETLAAGFFPGSSKACSQFLRHKMSVISPLMLKKYSIPFYKMTQHAGEFMITFPYGYHSGYNQGFNCAESTNFASLRWIDFGKKAKPCACRKDNVKIEMALFVKKYQPKQYKQFMESIAKKKQGTTEQAEEEFKDQKKQGKNIKVKRYNRYPSLSGVRSLAKHVTREAEYGNRPVKMNVKKQQAIRKAKDILKKAEKARRESIGKMKLNDNKRTEGMLPTSLDKNASNKDSTMFIRLSMQENQAQDQKNIDERMKKLLEIKEEMEREMQMKKERMEKINTARERRQKLREVKQSLRKRESARKRSSSDVLTKPLPIDSVKKDMVPNETKAQDAGNIEESGILHGLWINEKTDVVAEITYNKVISKDGNGCAVCAYFDPEMARAFAGASSSNHFHHGPKLDKSIPFVPELCFMRSLNNPSTSDLLEPVAPLMGSESPLVTCRACCVTVHQRCYGLEEETIDRLNWLCNRCQPILTGWPDTNHVRCELCPIRGGALRQTTLKRWAHIVCAISFFDVSFSDIKKRGPVDLTSLNSARARLKCVYCRRSSSSTENNGACVQCAAGKCAQSFHVTCSFHNGVSLHAGDWPLTVEPYCHKHVKTKNSKTGKRLLPEIQVNDSVYAKHKNGRFYKGRVESVDASTFYYVVFEDGSFCHDLPPQDIVGYHPGLVYSNEDKVDVLWTDGVIYPSIVKSCEKFLRFEIVFENGSVLSLRREDIYREDEELPKKVLSKLSYATETANLLWQASDIRQSPTRKAKTDKKRISKLF